MDDTESTAPKTRYPGIVPVFLYRWHKKRALTTKQDRAESGDEDWLQLCDARTILYNPIYGIAKFTDTQGNVRVVDGGVMWTPIYDFCGGIIATSAFVGVFGTKSDKTWGAGYWHTIIGAYGNDVWQTAYARNASTDKWDKFSDMIPDLHAFCGPAPMTTKQAEDVMRRSIAAALITTSWNNGRKGIFAADRTEVSPKTKEVLELGADVPCAYNSLPGVQQWAGEGGRKTHVGRVFNPAQAHVYNAKAQFDPGTTYRNPNSGHDVAMCSLIVDTMMGTSHLCHARTKQYTPWTITKEEADKFCNPEIYDLLPQGMFHNG